MKINLKSNEIKFISYRSKRFLSKDILSVWALLSTKKPLFFCVLCGRGDLPSSNRW